MSIDTSTKHIYRKRLSVIWLSIETALVSSTIFGFNAIFEILSKDHIYDSYCIISNETNVTISSNESCDEQQKKYQEAVALGLIFFNLPTVFVGICIDLFGIRSVKLISIIFHVIGWLSLGFAQPGQDHLIFIHTVFTAFSGSCTMVTTYASSAYFSKSRAFISTIFTGAGIISGIWFTIFQILIDNNKISLRQICFIWASFGVLLLISSFLFLDWKFPFLNLSYQFDTKQDEITMRNPESSETTNNEKKWYKRIYKRLGIWKYLTSPLYIMIVLFLSTLFITTDLLAITWYPMNYDLYNHDASLGNIY
ncbi:unnamed protein product [Adineta ricciae]|uniref:Uncharacterized protein n=1 Tax=Adineta ricciae TaxID=249248 RepID=A0A816FGJ4_ADIRI|nr:unnamed protein product [Adineta ricciae]